MNAKALIIASLLVALAGLAFVVPTIASAKFDAVACPGPPCVTRWAIEGYNGGMDTLATWGPPRFCSASVNGCTGDNGCCQQCLNWGYDEAHTVGYCHSECSLLHEYYDKTCPV